MLEVQRLKHDANCHIRAQDASDGWRREVTPFEPSTLFARRAAEWRVNSCASQRDTRKTSSPLSVMINSVHLRRLSSIMEHKVPVLWPCIQGAVNYLVPDCQTAVIRLSFGLIIQWEVKAHNLGYLTRGQGHPWTRAGSRGRTTDPEWRKPSKHSHLPLKPFDGMHMQQIHI